MRQIFHAQEYKPLYYTLDEENNPVLCDDVKEWEIWMEWLNPESKKAIVGEYGVRTTFIGYSIDPEALGNLTITGEKIDQDSPVLWVTGVYKLKDRYWLGKLAFTSSYNSAMEYHNKCVEELKKEQAK